jgi:hypothetical protein
VISFVTADSAAAEASQVLACVLARIHVLVDSICEQVKFPGVYETPADSRMDVSQSENIRFRMSAMSLQGSALSPITPMLCSESPENNL